MTASGAILVCNVLDATATNCWVCTHLLQWRLA